jgi:hypothetical protein
MESAREVPLTAGLPFPANAVRDPVVIAITSAYLDIVTESVTADEARELSISVAMLTDVDRLSAVGCTVGDAFPWVLFLQRLRSIPLPQRTERSDRAEFKLYLTAMSMLERRGLGLVRPEDLLARPTPFQEAVASFAPNTNI